MPWLYTDVDSHGKTSVSVEIVFRMNNRPFLGSDAVRQGRLTRTALRRDHRRIYRDVYIRRTDEIDAKTRACAAWLFSRGKAVVAGQSAAAIHGNKWIAADHRAELIWHGHRRLSDVIEIRGDKLPPEHIETIGGIRVTTAARTAFDLGRRGEFEEALIQVDGLCNATSMPPRTIEQLADQCKGVRGSIQLRHVVAHADAGAESPQESRLRLLIVNAGLPRPLTQIAVRGTDGRVFARIDMGWAKWKVAVEYDGHHHWSDARQRAWDIERAHRLETLGWTVIRVSSQLLSRSPTALIARIRDALRAAGAPV